MLVKGALVRKQVLSLAQTQRYMVDSLILHYL